MTARTSLSRAQRLTVAGWLVTVVFALLVAVVADEPGTGAVLAVLALAMAAWVALRGSRPAFWVSAVLGALHTLEQAAYLGADATAHHSVETAASDAVGLAGGLLVLVGSAASLRSRRHVDADSDREAVPTA